ncbi:MAG: glycosyltransferase family 4 protein [Parabacteroides sp.]|nr:glycosyltransferase family 4 protein [Parabacteroides sp.]
MKILIVTQYYYPEQFQINEIAPELVKRGHVVTVLCGLPNYPKGVVFEGYGSAESLEHNEREYLEKTGVKVVHVEQHPRGNNPLSLIRNYISFARNSKKTVRQMDKDFDVVLGYQLSPITSMEAVLEYKRLYGTPVVFYTLDIWPVSAEGMLKSKRNPLMIPVKRLSRRIYQGADRILVTSRPFMDYLHWANGIDFDRMAYLPQHAGDGMLNMDLSKGEGQEALATRRVDFMFAGNLGKGQRLDVIVEAAHILGRRKDYKIHFVGDGRMRGELENMVKEYDLQDNVIFYGNQKREDMPRFYKMADVLLITLRGNNEVGDTMPGKLQMYMTTGKPIFGAINGAAYEVIKEARCGSCVKAGDYEGLAKLMKLYIEHPSDFEQCGHNAHDYFLKHFTLDIYMDGLEKELESMARKK